MKLSVRDDFPPKFPLAEVLEDKNCKLYFLTISVYSGKNAY
jgi:hypothetical protein